MALEDEPEVAKSAEEDSPDEEAAAVEPAEEPERIATSYAPEIGKEESVDGNTTFAESFSAEDNQFRSARMVIDESNKDDGEMGEDEDPFDFLMKT